MIIFFDFVVDRSIFDSIRYYAVHHWYPPGVHGAVPGSVRQCRSREGVESIPHISRWVQVYFYLCPFELTMTSFRKLYPVMQSGLCIYSDIQLFSHPFSFVLCVFWLKYYGTIEACLNLLLNMCTRLTMSFIHESWN